jgi:ABC-2 type transport system permease protein
MFKMAWVYNMEYRLNFIMWMIVNVLWTILDLIFFNVLMGSTQIIGSWTQADTFIMIGIFRLMGVFVWGWMESSFEMLPALVNEGRLDLILTKPVDAQFYISFHRIGTSVIASFISGIMLIVTGMALTVA